MRFLKYIFCALLFVTASVADTININWMDGNTTYAQTTCEIGGDIILPSPPTKRGYTFKGWRARYTRLEYIESTGTQYIDTGIMQGKFVHDIKFSNTTNRCLMGTNSSTGGYWGANSNKTAYVFGASGGGIPGVPLERKTITFNNLDNTNITFTVDGNTYAYTEGVSISNNYSILHITNASYYSEATLYGFKAYNANDKLICNLIPAKRNSDSAIGMYDTVSGTFFTNAGTGEFVAGPVAENQNFYE